MGRYLVRVTRTVVEVRDIEVEAKDEEEAEANAVDEVRYTESREWWEERGSRYEPECIETLEVDEDETDESL